MNSIRVRFTRGENVKFISHLDLMKAFERAIRRSGLPIAYSQGFNPHPHMVFGLPLSVGVTSDGEYADFDMARQISPQQFMETLNASLPNGIRITEADEKVNKANIMASISGADYTIDIFLKEQTTLEEARAKLQTLLSMSEVKVLKEGKGKAKEINIRPMIHSAEIEAIKSIPRGYEGFAAAFTINTRFSAGNTANLRPELFVKALADSAGLSSTSSRVHRRALYIDDRGRMADPMDKTLL